MAGLPILALRLHGGDDPAPLFMRDDLQVVLLEHNPLLPGLKEKAVLLIPVVVAHDADVEWGYA